MHHDITHAMSFAMATCVVSISLLAGSHVAAATEPEDSGYAFFFDNDLLALDSWTHVNDDRNYTMGLAFAVGGRRYASTWLGTPRNYIDQYLNNHDDNPKATLHAVIFGVTAFTPNDLEDPAPIPFDRPYAGLAFIANQKTSADGKSEVDATRSTLVLGILGLRVAKGVQRFLHNDLDISSQDPLGWRNQISDGGEMTALYTADRLRRVRSGASHDLTANLGYKAGYYTGLSAGLDLRLGRLGSKFYEHSPNPMANYNQMVKGRDLYGFLSYQATLVGYNVLLQGQFRDTPRTFSGSQVERLVHWIGTGLVYDAGWGRLTYSFNYRSQEFKGPEAREHYWGGLYFTHNYQ